MQQFYGNMWLWLSNEAIIMQTYYCMKENIECEVERLKGLLAPFEMEERIDDLQSP